MDNITSANESYIEKINAMLAGKKNAVINIINDKLTLSVFAALEKNLKNVKEINFIIRDTSNLPRERIVEREFIIESELNPKDALFGRYDIVEKNTLKHFAKAKSMYAFIKKYINVRRTTAKADVGINLLVIDDEFMISGTSSLEITQKPKKQARFSFNFDSVMTEQMDKAQIVGARREFERLWHNDFATADFKEELLNSLGYIYKEHSPEFLYYFTLNELFGGQLNESGIQKFETDNAKFKQTKIWQTLYNFQKECAWSAIQKLNKYNGCIIADSVGLGKTFEALAVIKYFEIRNDNVLVLTPARLYDNWMSFKGAYKDNSLGEDFHYKIMFHTDLSRFYGDSRSGYDLSRFDWGKFDLIVIDESHNFRNRTEKDDSVTRYMRLMNEVIKNKQKTKVLLLSATPVNNSLVDLRNQISLITGDRDDAFKDEGIESVSRLLAQTTSIINYWDAQPTKDKSLLYDRLPPMFYKLLEMLTIVAAASI